MMGKRRLAEVLYNEEALQRVDADFVSFNSVNTVHNVKLSFSNGVQASSLSLMRAGLRNMWKSTSREVMMEVCLE